MQTIEIKIYFFSFPFQIQISSLDAVIELKQLLMESVETCYITHYELRIGETTLQDFSEIASYPEIQPECTITMHTSELI